MRIVLDEVAVETTKYTENGDICLTCFTDGEAPFQQLSAVLDGNRPVVALRRNGEQFAMRVCEHEVWPPHSRSLDGSVHRHDIRLEFAPAQ